MCSLGPLVRALNPQKKYIVFHNTAFHDDTYNYGTI